MAGIEFRKAHFPGRPPIDAYGNGGFRFADISHRGSILCLPSGVFGWDAATPEDITLASIAAILNETRDIDFLLMGTGMAIEPIPLSIKTALKARRISSDPMSTGAAVRTYNVMLAEQRAVAAALIAV